MPVPFTPAQLSDFRPLPSELAGSGQMEYHPIRRGYRLGYGKPVLVGLTAMPGRSIITGPGCVRLPRLDAAVLVFQRDLYRHGFLPFYLHLSRVRRKRFELLTRRLRAGRSTAELAAHGAPRRNRTGMASLEGKSSAIELVRRA